ncbi:ROK family transcriptional regulator [Microbacterium arborescens]|uniref:ROK family transcriptional regulator n=1 Tax=Microbacterium TaxID=33882 RepID=UPI0025A0185C|nr:ROK family transcriptional regulator [Microbacterium arborescens]WJM16259.1 ROK family transcriptional regulator [Microbacterium arborescens]
MVGHHEIEERMTPDEAAPSRATATTRTVTLINQTAILDALRTRGPLGRVELVEATGLATATVHRLCTRLVDDGAIVVERDLGGAIGRPTHRYRYAGETRSVIALDVTDTCARGALIDLNGDVRHTEERSLIGADGALDPASRLDGTLRLVDDLRTAAALRGIPAYGVGVAVPGVVAPTGHVGDSVELGWVDVPLRDLIAERTGLPTVVENDANAVAVGEWSHGAGRGSANLATFVLGVGLGAGIVADGRLLRGARAAAGEIGHLIADRSGFTRAPAAGGDLESRILELGASRSPLARRESTLGILDEYADGSDAARGPATELLDYIAMSVAALAVVLDCGEVILTGALPERAGVLVDEIDRRLTGRIPAPPRILIGELGERAAVVGIGQLAIDRVNGALYLA